MHFLFIFLDGVGLGSTDPGINPFAHPSMPCLQNLLEGKRLLASDSPSAGRYFFLSGLDACLGIEGMPQSATGQAALLTGVNVPELIGKHYGPKPNEPIADILSDRNLFKKLKYSGKKAGLLNAYPDRFFESINSGRRLLSAIPLAVKSAEIPLKNTIDYYAGNAISADFTGKGWREHLNLPDAPLYTPEAAGKKLADLALDYDFAFFEFWLSDYVGHSQEMTSACDLLSEFDKILGGLLSAWDFDHGIIYITSDHGNLEDLSTHRHTLNEVPSLVIGIPSLRKYFSRSVQSLIDVSPAVLEFFSLSNE